jgi:hypothetical protein
LDSIITHLNIFDGDDTNRSPRTATATTHAAASAAAVAAGSAISCGVNTTIDNHPSSPDQNRTCARATRARTTAILVRTTFPSSTTEEEGIHTVIGDPGP